MLETVAKRKCYNSKSLPAKIFILCLLLQSIPGPPSVQGRAFQAKIAHTPVRRVTYITLIFLWRLYVSRRDHRTGSDPGPALKYTRIRCILAKQLLSGGRCS
jgi:hypothetical protein